MSGMRFDTNQSMKLGQQMKLAPRMIQSMEILQMGLPALQERIDQELESNVALEVVERGDVKIRNRRATRFERRLRVRQRSRVFSHLSRAL